MSRLVLEGAYEGTLLAAAKGHSERLRAADEAGPSGEQVMTQNFSLLVEAVCLPTCLAEPVENTDVMNDLES